MVKKKYVGPLVWSLLVAGRGAPLRDARRLRHHDRPFSNCSLPGVEPHLYALPANGTLCVPQKNGNRNWAAFTFYASKGRPPASEKEARGHLGERSRENYADGGEVFIVARNPFARALSFYLRGRRRRRSRAAARDAPKKNAGTTSRTAASAASTRTAASAAGRRSRRPGASAGEARRAPGGRERPPPSSRYMQSTLAAGAARACLSNHHLCPQTSICGPRCLEAPPRVLKLETMATWFDGFVDDAGVDRAGLFGDAWRGFAGQSGFYLPAPVVTDNVHPTNATGRLLEFYTAETAAVVAATYADDFAYFGYCATFACLAAGGVG